MSESNQPKGEPITLPDFTATPAPTAEVSATPAPTAAPLGVPAEASAVLIEFDRKLAELWGHTEQPYAEAYGWVRAAWKAALATPAVPAEAGEVARLVDEAKEIFNQFYRDISDRERRGMPSGASVHAAIDRLAQLATPTVAASSGGYTDALDEVSTLVGAACSAWNDAGNDDAAIVLAGELQSKAMQAIHRLAASSTAEPSGEAK